MSVTTKRPDHQGWDAVKVTGSNGWRDGRVLLTVVAAVQVLAGFSQDFNATHVFNPSWPPHARYHAVLLLGTVALVSLLATWLVWTRRGDRGLNVPIAAVVLLATVLPFFAALLVPGTNPGHDVSTSSAAPQLLGVPINLVAEVLLALLIGLSYLLHRRARTQLVEGTAAKLRVRPRRTS